MLDYTLIKAENRKERPKRQTEKNTNGSKHESLQTPFEPKMFWSPTHMH
jgi:hypothetical protein